MARGAPGDGDYGEDPAVNELQRRASATLRTEAALFVPTATMANPIAVMCHCQHRGAQLFLGQNAHLHVCCWCPFLSNISLHDTKFARSKLEFVARKCQEKLALGLRPTPSCTGGA